MTTPRPPRWRSKMTSSPRVTSCMQWSISIRFVCATARMTRRENCCIARIWRWSVQAGRYLPHTRHVPRLSHLGHPMSWKPERVDDNLDIVLTDKLPSSISWVVYECDCSSAEEVFDALFNDKSAISSGLHDFGDRLGLRNITGTHLSAPLHVGGWWRCFPSHCTTPPSLR